LTEKAQPNIKPDDQKEFRILFNISRGFFFCWHLKFRKNTYISRTTV